MLYWAYLASLDFLKNCDHSNVAHTSWLFISIFWMVFVKLELFGLIIDGIIKRIAMIQRTVAGLPQVLANLPHRVCLHRIMPLLAKEFINPSMVPFVLPCALLIAADATKEHYVQYILPYLKPVMKIQDPVQVHKNLTYFFLHMVNQSNLIHPNSSK